MGIGEKMMLFWWKLKRIIEILRISLKNWRKTLKNWAQKKKTRSKQWENRRKMMKEDEYGWEDDVDVMKIEENHWDSKNITEIMKRYVEKMMKNEENKR